MDQAPAIIDRRVVQQPLHGAGTRPGDTVFHFLHLLGDMDVDRPVAGDRHELCQLFRRHGAQAMRRDAEFGAGQAAGDGAAA